MGWGLGWEGMVGWGVGCHLERCGELLMDERRVTERIHGSKRPVKALKRDELRVEAGTNSDLTSLTACDWRVRRNQMAGAARAGAPARPEAMPEAPTLAAQARPAEAPAR